MREKNCLRFKLYSRSLEHLSNVRASGDSRFWTLEGIEPDATGPISTFTTHAHHDISVPANVASFMTACIS